MGDRALAAELMRQNCAFVAWFAVIVWDWLITFRQEVNYVWHCSSRVTKYSFLFCRYCALGYFIACSIFGTQWALGIPTSRKDCRTWLLIDITSFCLLYIGSQSIIIRKVFYLYEKSTLLASGLFTLHCSHAVGTIIWSHHIAGSQNFNPICNGRNIPNGPVLALIGTTTCLQCITWSLILRKVWKVRPSRFFPRWRRYLLSSEAQANITCGLCLVAVLFTSISHSFVSQRFTTVYIFRSPLTMLSIGVCRYILCVEQDRDMLSKQAEAIASDECRVKQRVLEQQSPSTELDKLPTQNRHRHLYPPRPSAKMPSLLSAPEALAIQTTENPTRRHNLDSAIETNFPYLHGAQSYKLKKNRRSMDTTITSDSPQGSFDYASRQTVSVRTSRSCNSGFGSGPNPRYGFNAAGSAHSEARNDLDETHSMSNIEIGSLHISSSVNSEELCRFYNDTWNPGPFGP